MKTKILSLLLLSSLSATAAWADVPPEVENPFAEGTGAVVIDADTQATIREYSLTSKNQLEQTLRDTATLVAADAVPMMLNTVRDVVVRSHSISRGRELLFRIVLNQALEMTVGRPNASGTGREAPGVLSQHLDSQTELIYRILRDSMMLAQGYAERDADLVIATAGQSAPQLALLSLPYGSAAAERLALARAWNRSMTLVSPRIEYAFLRVALMQWLQIVTRSENVRSAELAPLIARTQSILQAYGNISNIETAPIGPINAGKRRMRGLLIELTEGAPTTASVDPGLGEEVRINPSNRTGHRTFSIGDSVIPFELNERLEAARVIGVSPDSKYVIEIQNERSLSRISGVNASQLASASGCHPGGACVGQAYILTSRDNVEVEIIGLNPNGNYIVEIPAVRAVEQGGKEVRYARRRERVSNVPFGQLARIS